MFEVSSKSSKNNSAKKFDTINITSYNYRISMSKININNIPSQPSSNKLNRSSNRSLFVVGDDAQSIYGFRGSNIDIILTFDKVYKGTKEIILNQNYRSNQAILDLAENVIKQNSNQKKKGLFTNNLDKKNVFYYTANNEKDEGEFIIRTLAKLYSAPKNKELNTKNPSQLSQDLSLSQLNTLLD